MTRFMTRFMTLMALFPPACALNTVSELVHKRVHFWSKTGHKWVLFWYLLGTSWVPGPYLPGGYTLPLPPVPAVADSCLRVPGGGREAVREARRLYQEALPGGLRHYQEDPGGLMTQDPGGLMTQDREAS